VDPHHLSSAGILTGSGRRLNAKRKKFNSVKDEHDELQRTLTKSRNFCADTADRFTSSSSGNTGGDTSVK